MQVIELTALSYSALCAGIDCSQYRPHFCNATAPSPPLHWRCSPAVAYRPDAAAMEFKEMDWNKYIQDTIDKGLKK